MFTQKNIKPTAFTDFKRAAVSPSQNKIGLCRNSFLGGKPNTDVAVFDLGFRQTTVL